VIGLGQWKDCLKQRARSNRIMDLKVSMEHLKLSKSRVERLEIVIRRRDDLSNKPSRTV